MLRHNMDPAISEEAHDHGHKSRQSSSGSSSFEAYLATIPDKFDVSGDDLITAGTENTTISDQNSKLLQAFDDEYGIKQRMDERPVAKSSSSNHQGLLSHVTENRAVQNVLTRSDPTSPTVVSQLITADVSRHQSEPLNQQIPNSPKQHDGLTSHVPATIARSLSTSEFHPATSTQLNTKPILQETPKNLTTLPLKKHLNRPLNSSPLARQSTINAEDVQTLIASNNPRTSSSAIVQDDRVPEFPSAPEDRRYKFATSSPFVGFAFDSTEQAVNSVTQRTLENASYYHGTYAGTQHGQAGGFKQHALDQNPYGTVGAFEVYSNLRHALPSGNRTVQNQPDVNWSTNSVGTDDEAQLEQTRSARILGHNAQGSFMRSENGLPYLTTPLSYPQYYVESNHYNQSGNFQFGAAQTSQQLVLKSERVTENAGNRVNYGQPPNQRKHYGGNIPTAGLEFADTFMLPDDVPDYPPRVSRGSPTSDLKFSCLYDFENQKDPTNIDHSWRSDATYPHTRSQEQTYVKDIIMAMSDMGSANDNPGMLEMWTKIMKNTKLLEITAWKLLRSCNKSHKHIQSLAHGPRIPQRPQIYEDHIHELCKALKEQKTICKHLLSADYAESFVDDPINAALRVNNNRKVNGGKKMAIERGRRAMSMVKGTRDPEEVELELSMMKNEYDQPMEGYSRQASQQLTNTGTTEGSGLKHERSAAKGGSEYKQEQTEMPATPGPRGGSAKKSIKKSSSTKKTTPKSPVRRSTRKPKANSKDDNEDSDNDDESYEPLKTPKRKRANRNTKYPTTQLADGSYVIKTTTSPPATSPSRRKRQATHEASATDEDVTVFGRPSSNFGQAGQSARNNNFAPRRDFSGKSAGDAANGRGRLNEEQYPFMFGYPSQNPAHQLQYQGVRGANPFDFVDPGLTGPNFHGPLHHYDTAGSPQAEPGHGMQDEGENYHLSLGRRRFRPFTEPPLEDDSNEEGN